LPQTLDTIVVERQVAGPEASQSLCGCRLRQIN